MSIFSQFRDHFLLIFLNFRHQKSLIFMELSSFLKVLLFRLVMLFLSCFSGLLGPLGGLWGLILEAFGRHLGPLGAVLGRTRGRPRDFLRASWPPRRPRCPQEPQRRLPEASQTPPEASRRHPRGVQEAFQRPQTVIIVVVTCYASTWARRNARSD